MEALSRPSRRAHPDRGRIAALRILAMAAAMAVVRALRCIPQSGAPARGDLPSASSATMPALLSRTHEPMSEATRPELPDHLSVDPRSPHHVAAIFEHDIGIRFNGKERQDVEEYCISEGWVKVPAGKTLDRKGRPLCIKLKGVVEAFYR
jgi:hypothetical protein